MPEEEVQDVRFRRGKVPKGEQGRGLTHVPSLYPKLACVRHNFFLK
jgi:hypothetical protein